MRRLIVVTLIGLLVAVFVAVQALRASDSPKRVPPIQLQTPGDSPAASKTTTRRATDGDDVQTEPPAGSPGPEDDGALDDYRAPEPADADTAGSSSDDGEYESAEDDD